MHSAHRDPQADRDTQTDFYTATDGDTSADFDTPADGYVDAPADIYTSSDEHPEADKHAAGDRHVTADGNRPSVSNADPNPDPAPFRCLRQVLFYGYGLSAWAYVLHNICNTSGMQEPHVRG